MSDYFLGEIRLFPYNRVPKGWHVCDGTIIPVKDHQALASLLGNFYGGDGRTTFALPDLRGRVPTGISEAFPRVGIKFGVESVPLTTETIPPHSHTVNAISREGNQTVPLAAYPATVTGDTPPAIYGGGTEPETIPLALSTVEPTGNGQGHENRQPTIVLQHCISMIGIYPPRR
ncbi:MAG: phage tail protein [Rhodospirillaceae bacterium]|nr:phage tail protein [Rhodospirillaceae bacterium]